LISSIFDQPKAKQNKTKRHMVLTRYQHAKLQSNTDCQQQDDLVKDPPLLTISRSRDSFDDEPSTFKVDTLLEQLDE
jgi:hypothetical protein